jgi:hypothetical protein
MPQLLYSSPSALISSRALLKLMHHQYDHCLMKQKGSNIKAVALGHHEGNVIMGQKGMHLNEFNNNGDDYHFGIPHRYSMVIIAIIIKFI